MAVRTIDSEKCVGCGTCVETCPMDVFRLDIRATQANEYSPCRVACPLGVNQREYHNLIKLDLLDEAAQCLGQYHPMPVITGRICPHPCENECTRKKVDTAININGLEQYLGDHLLEMDKASTVQSNGTKVAIIGGGPAGLSAAYFLCTKGYEITVFDKEEKAGGMLRTTIPAFRLPVDVLDKQIAYYESMGISFQCNVKVGEDISVDDLRAQGYKACIATVGADKPYRLSVDGVNAQGVTTAMDYLKAVKSGVIKTQPGKVAVIGGGSVALDSARSAVRLGAEEVHLICLENIEAGHKDCMLAPRQEIEDAIDEGVIIHGGRSTHHFEVADDKVTGIKLVECKSVRELDGRFNPVYGTDVLDEELSVQTVVLAIGQGADASYAPKGYETNQRGYIVADGTTYQVAEDLFAAGDGVSGPSTVVRALGAGKKAAIAVDNFLKGEELSAGLAATYNEYKDVPLDKIFTSPRNERATLPASEAKFNFEGTVFGLDWQQASMEANRCLTCGSRSTIGYVADCQACSLCVNYCPTDAITVGPGHIPNVLHAWDVLNLAK